MLLTIDSPNNDRSLLTLSELRAAIGVTDSSKDAMLQPLGAYISAMITKACKVAAAGAIPPTLRLETVTQTFRLKSEQKCLVLARRPVVNIVSVTESESELAADDYECDEAAGLFYRITGSKRSCWPCGTIVVEFSSGWATVPDDLKYAAIKFVQAEVTTSGRDPLLKRLRIEGVSDREWWVEPSKDAIVPSEVMSMLTIGGYAEPVIA